MEKPEGGQDLGVEIVRELNTTAESIAAVGKRMDEFQRKVQDLEGQVQNLDKRTVLPQDDDGAKEQTRDLLATIKRELDLMKAKGLPTRAVSVPGTEDSGFSFARAFYAKATGDWRNAGHEREVFEAAEAQARTMGVTVDTQLGSLLPVEIMAEFLPLLRARAVTIAAGARELSGLSAGEIRLPKQSGGMTAYRVAPSSEPTETDVTASYVSARPKTIAVLGRMQKELLQRGIPSVEALVRADMATVFGLKMDLDALSGSGSSNTPLGIANHPSVNTESSIGSIPAMTSFTKYISAYGKVEDDNVDLSSGAWIKNPATYRAICEVQTTNGEYLLKWDPREGAPKMFLGYPVLKSTQVRKTLGGGGNEHEGFFGVWSNLIHCLWGSLQLDSSEHADGAFKKREVLMMLNQDHDVLIRYPEGFTYLSGQTV